MNKLGLESEHSMTTAATSEDKVAAIAEMSEVDSEGPDFSYLPETALVRILEYLPIKDQYHVSVTCSRLCHMLSHPTLWRSARLNLVGGQHNFRLSRTFMPQQFKRIVERFGHLFQRLTISISGHLIQFEDNTREILSDMAKVCRLEHLVLQVGLVTSDFHRPGLKPNHDDLLEIVQLVSNAFRLREIEILSWPMFTEIFDNENVNVFEVMKNNSKLANLETLKMFWLRDRQWSELAPLLPSPSYTLTLVSHFRALKHLALRSPMLCSDLLVELASSSRTKLLSLQILIIYSAHDAKFRIPSITSAAWSILRAASPDLEVECAIMSRVPDIELAGLLRPEVPLLAVKFLKYARCSAQLLSSLKDKYHETLQSFICYNDPADCEDQLVEMVTACNKISTVVFHGQIHSTKITELAQLRGHWQEFEFLEKLIVTETQEEGFDEDTVIGRGTNGDLVQVGLVRFHGYESGTQRQLAVEEMCREVSTKVGYNWKPREKPV